MRGDRLHTVKRNLQVFHSDKRGGSLMSLREVVTVHACVRVIVCACVRACVAQQEYIQKLMPAADR